jgi:hypothetical protein
MKRIIGAMRDKARALPIRLGHVVEEKALGDRLGIKILTTVGGRRPCEFSIPCLSEGFRE